MPDQKWCLAISNRDGLNEIDQFLNQIRPVTADGVARIMAKHLQRFDRKTAFAQLV